MLLFQLSLVDVSTYVWQQFAGYTKSRFPVTLSLASMRAAAECLPAVAKDRGGSEDGGGGVEGGGDEETPVTVVCLMSPGLRGPRCGIAGPVMEFSDLRAIGLAEASDGVPGGATSSGKAQTRLRLRGSFSRACVWE